MTGNLDDPVDPSAADIARRVAVDAVRAYLEEISRLAQREDVNGPADAPATEPDRV